MRDEPAREQSELDILDHAVEIPGAIQLVAGLVILLRFPFLDLLPAPAGRPADEIGAVIEVQCRNTDLRERELVGTVVVAAIGKLIGLHDAALPLCNRFGPGRSRTSRH